METVIRDGHLQRTATGLPESADGLQALLQRAYNCFCIRHGAFCYDRSLGSRIFETGENEEHEAERVLRYAQAALLRYPEVEAEAVSAEEDGFQVTVKTALGEGEVTVKRRKT